jgi:CheY-like chemotaxis protein
MAQERILIVDDDPWILRMVSALLEKKGYTVITASDGDDGLHRAEQLRPDLIISDVMMPRMDGWAMIKSLRARPDLAMTPVIFLTALGSEEDRLRGFRLGADDYLPKPFRFEELDLRVGNALRKGRETRAAAQRIAAAAPTGAPGAPPPIPRDAGARRPGSGATPPPPPQPASPSTKVGIHGNLEQLGLSSLLVILEMERKSGILRLEKVGAVGRLFAREGRIVAARVEGEAAPADARRGPQAVYHLLTWSSGRFDFTVVEVDMEDEIKLSTTNLLMEGARLIDEQNRF